MTLEYLLTNPLILIRYIIIVKNILSLFRKGKMDVLKTVYKTGLPEHVPFSVTKVLELALFASWNEQVPGFSRNLEE
ncbi:hypothetical protein Avbf_15857 [Armadillidium vulgare]|nr:hypothetical protein Avbf_15857 [Armadillidium vulgare]